MTAEVDEAPAFGPTTRRTETSKMPMSKTTYDDLTSVHGFRVVNGATYAEYVSNWWKRIGHTAPVDPRTGCAFDAAKLIARAASHLFTHDAFATETRHDTDTVEVYCASAWDTPTTAYKTFTTTLITNNKDVTWEHGDRNGSWKAADGSVDVEINEHAMELLEWYELFVTGVALRDDVYMLVTYMHDADQYDEALLTDAKALSAAATTSILLATHPAGVLM